MMYNLRPLKRRAQASKRRAMRAIGCRKKDEDSALLVLSARSLRRLLLLLLSCINSRRRKKGARGGEEKQRRVPTTCEAAGETLRREGHLRGVRGGRARGQETLRSSSRGDVGYTRSTSDATRGRFATQESMHSLGCGLAVVGKYIEKDSSPAQARMGAW